MTNVLGDPAVLAECLADSSFAFSLRGWPGDGPTFFLPSQDEVTLLAERRHWLAVDPSRYVAAEDSRETCDVLDEMRKRLAETGLVNGTGADPCDADSFPGGDAARRCLALGRVLEPDFVVLRSGLDGGCGGQSARGAVVLGGVVAFPSHWDFPSTLGQSVGRIHAVVPGLNEAIGVRIDQFLERLRAGKAWFRINWGISASAEPNQHPSRVVRRVKELSPPFSSSDLWFRVELQVLWRLPETGGIVFGIRPFSISFDRLREASSAGALRRQIATLPEAMCRYKGLGSTERARAIAEALA